MALLNIEGFDDLASADVNTAGYSVQGSTPTMVAGRFGGQAAQFDLSTQNGVTYACAEQGITHGAAIRLDEAHSTAENTSPRLLAIASTTPNRCLIGVIYNTASQVLSLAARSTLSSGTTVASTTPGAVNIPVGVYVYMELSYDPVQEAAVVRLNGEVVLAVGSGANPYSRAMAGTSVAWGDGASPLGVTVDDWYTNEGYLQWKGECKVVTRYPTSDTAAQDLTPSSGSDHYAMVDENPQDGDVTYVEGEDAGATDRYASSDDIGNPDTIHAVAVRSIMKKTDVDSKTARNVVRSGSSTSNGPTETMTTSYSGYMSIHETNPNGGAEWTAPAVEASEFGVQIVS